MCAPLASVTCSRAAAAGTCSGGVQFAPQQWMAAAEMRTAAPLVVTAAIELC